MYIYLKLFPLIVTIKRTKVIQFLYPISQETLYIGMFLVE